MRIHCTYCRVWIYADERKYLAGTLTPGSKVCDKCKPMVDKLNAVLGEVTVDRLMELISNRAQEQVDRHEDRYNHESDGGPF